MISKDSVYLAAMRELREEKFRKAVDKEKERLRHRKKHWFPWRIRIVNINK